MRKNKANNGIDLGKVDAIVETQFRGQGLGIVAENLRDKGFWLKCLYLLAMANSCLRKMKNRHSQFLWIIHKLHIFAIFDHSWFKDIYEC